MPFLLEVAIASSRESSGAPTRRTEDETAQDKFVCVARPAWKEFR